MGMKACAKEQFGTDSLEGRKIAVQGVGHVGEYLVQSLVKEGAIVSVTDVYEPTLKRIANTYGVNVVGLDEIYDIDMDIYAPCALGATINDDTVFNMKAKVIAGAANNQLATEERHGVLLRERGIVYAPDFLINAGGIINVYAELEGYDKQEIMRKTENIYNTTLEILETANREVLTTNRAALNIAKQRIEDRKKVNFK